MKLIILSGKARSGKDEAEKIIENFYSDKKCIAISFAYYLKDYLKRMGLYNEEVKPRKLMQEFGKELREKFSNTFLIDRVLEDIKIFSDYYDIIIITDARLIEEVELVKEKYPTALTLRIERPNYENDLTIEERKDITEVGLDDYDGFDYIVINDDNFKDNVLRCLDE